MTITRQSTSYHHAVGAVLKRLQDIDRVDFGGAGYLDDFDLRRVLHPHGPGKVCGSIGAVMTAEGDDFGGKVW